MKNELRECPFCGEDDVAQTRVNQGHSMKPDRFYIKHRWKNGGGCILSDIETLGYSTKEQAIQAWNCRAGEKNEE